MSFTNTSISSEFMGLQHYEDVLLKQSAASLNVRGTSAIRLFGMEFHPVITLGIRGDMATDLLPSHVDIPVVKTDRGGQATLHTPGQLVIYPMMDIKSHGIGVRDFVCLITKATSRLLSQYGIESFQGAAPGLYTANGKIAFLGIRLDNGVVRHGLALNVFNDTTVFGSIKSCGVMAAKIDKIQNYDVSAGKSLVDIFQEWTECFDQELTLLQRANSANCDLQLPKEPLSIEVHNSRADIA